MPEETPSASIADLTTLDQSVLSSAGSVGRYRLRQRLGEGGMGEVWLAEQTEPVRRQVALKVIKAGMDSAQVIARFAAERQALALMDHPAIARVFDGGVTPQGRPFFAMEYVRGEPITTYCDRHRLSTEDRLALFLELCEGVQHAHHKGIIHRDLKPSNVLVTIQGDRPAPKIIDFGVAKATARQLTDQVLLTELGTPIGTAEYMSPEQAEMGALDIDTRTDVYALGVTLYELLTGALPFASRELRAAGPTEIHRIIREKEPKRPSTRVTELALESAEAARNRDTEPRRLAGRLRGDLDWITMKALEKDRTRRYGSASEMAADIRRHLANEPVLAGPPSVFYRARKFWQRHRVGVAASAALLALFVALSVVTSIQAVRIARERDRANEEARAKEQIAGFMKQLFKVSDPSQARGSTVTAREILDEGLRTIDVTLGDQPALRAELTSEMGEVYDSLGLYVEAERLKRQAVALRRQALGPEHLKTLVDTRTLAALLDIRFGRHEEAAELLVPTLATAKRALGGDHDETLKIESALATALSGERREREAESLFLDVVDRRKRLSGADHPATLVALNNLSGLYHAQERYEDSARLDAEILEARRRTLGETHPQTIDAMNNLAYCLIALKRYDEARGVLERAIALGEKVWGVTHPQFGLLLHTRGELAAARGDLKAAEADLLRALQSYDRREYANYRPLALYELAQVEARLGKTDPAIGHLERALATGYRPSGSAPPFSEDPKLASLRAHPRFEALAAGAGEPTRTGRAPE
jgi:non-specific serine/threonine protein kinase/serine/threonine-protein kinase